MKNNGWVVVKSSRSGSKTFVFLNKEAAEYIAALLSKYNPVGFIVEEYIPNSSDKVFAFYLTGCS